MSSPTEIRHGIGLAAGAYLLWGLLTIYWKALDGFPPLELIGWRLLMALMLLMVVLVATGRRHIMMAVARDRALRRRVVLAGALLGINWTGYVYAVVTDQIIETALGYFMAPLGTMLIGVLVLGERLRAALVAAMVLAVAAVGVLSVSYGRVPFVALVLAGTWCVYGLLKKQVPLRPFEGLAAETASLALPALALVAWGAARTDSVVRTASGVQWLLVAGSGLISILPLALFAAASHRVPLTVLGPMQFLVPSINFLLGWIVYGEQVPLSRFTGFLLVWTALCVVAIDSLRRRRLETDLIVEAAVP
jgi:chloramphenicol-sensitive protein RarD